MKMKKKRAIFVKKNLNINMLKIIIIKLGTIAIAQVNIEVLHMTYVV